MSTMDRKGFLARFLGGLGALGLAPKVLEAQEGPEVARDSQATPVEFTGTPWTVVEEVHDLSGELIWEVTHYGPLGYSYFLTYDGHRVEVEPTKVVTHMAAGEIISSQLTIDRPHRKDTFLRRSYAQV